MYWSKINSQLLIQAQLLIQDLLLIRDLLLIQDLLSIQDLLLIFSLSKIYSWSKICFWSNSLNRTVLSNDLGCLVSNVVVRNVSNVALNFLKIVRATTPFSVTPCHVTEVVKVIIYKSRSEPFVWNKIWDLAGSIENLGLGRKVCLRTICYVLMDKNGLKNTFNCVLFY